MSDFCKMTDNGDGTYTYTFECRPDHLPVVLQTIADVYKEKLDEQIEKSIEGEATKPPVGFLKAHEII